MVLIVSSTLFARRSKSAYLRDATNENASLGVIVSIKTSFYMTYDANIANSS